MKLRNSSLLMAIFAMAGLALAVNESEPNDAIIQANAFTIGNTLTGGLPGGFGSDSALEDFWGFSATNAVNYTFNATSNGSFVSPLDIGLEIRNSSNGSLVIKDDNGDNQPENLNWTAPSTGTFYIIVYEATGLPNGISTYNVTTGVASSVDNWSLY